MKIKVKNIPKNKILFILILFVLAFVIYYFSIEETREINQVLVNSEYKKKPLVKVYPKQYSDRFQSETAIISDEKYKNISFFERRSLLSNVISSFLNKGEVISDGSLENGTWLWTPIKYITPEYRDSIILGAKKKGINVIYLSIDSYLDIFTMPEGEEKDKAKIEFDRVIKDFIKVANANGIKVDAEAGWQNWAEKEHLYKAGAVLDYVISFNRDNEEKFRGFQYDVEVYLLAEYKVNKEVVLKNFLDLIDKSVTKINQTSLQFSVVIPEFYDDSTLETQVFKYKGKMKHTLEHLLSVLERRSGSKIIVMSYRNFANGEDGSIKISEDEIYIANNYSTKVIIAQETGDFPPSYITFHRKSKNYFDSQVALLVNAFEDEQSFGGMATHYVNTFLELK